MPRTSPATSPPGTGARPQEAAIAPPDPQRHAARMVALTSAAILCFSANSIFCRLALAPGLIDPASFTTLRILSAAVLLSAGVWLKRRHVPRLARARPRSIAAVFAYLVFFSFAYTRLGAATGALILIAAVQLTMMAIALWRGERFSRRALAGFAAAVAGVLYLLLPGAAAPDPVGALLMAVSGAAWGIFTLSARSSDDPEETNAINLLGCLVPAVLVNVAWAGAAHATAQGVALAVASGALATGLGYIVWYLALRDLSATQAATVQLSMPAVVALGGVVFLAEPLSPRLLVASAAMLGGIAVVLTAPRGRPSQRDRSVDRRG